jgi:carbon monoxide dehydrogenase subunit G
VKLDGEHRFTSSRAEVWRALQDPQMLANALPGVRRLDLTGPDSYDVTVTVGVGAVKGTYDGTFSLSEKQELESCKVQANASGPPGSISTIAAMSLRDADDGGTVLTFEADAKVTGPLAGVGQRMVAAAAKKTTREFLSAIDRELTAGPAPAAAAGSASATNTAAAPPAYAADSVVQGPASGSPSAGVFFPSAPAGGDGDRELKLLGGGLVMGFLLALVGVLIGRRTAGR